MNTIGEARGYACNALLKYSSSEIQILFLKLHFQNAHKLKSCVVQFGCIYLFIYFALCDLDPYDDFILSCINKNDLS